MRWVTKAAGVLAATLTGLAVGAAGGVAFALFTWGLSLGLGAAVGVLAGLAAGVLAVADGRGRYEYRGPGLGAVLGLLVSGGIAAHAAADRPDTAGPWTTGYGVMAAGWFLCGIGSGWLAGLFAERVGRAVVESV